ncbi:MDR family MFS transporter [Actinocorallia sp. A-T 12471]|uniref:MDR family MFS transporter n=1 Tax=Actinocorallia sp. A-T 12471 TaxID=3089813 RepID=UPI0029CD6D80|nr:MDR family MFS transporter [Actinocorallia sp. A-T 12471]MDX6742417.1 MDR family MFS transporter [Actinocorallia sp. A-T 12471]
MAAVESGQALSRRDILLAFAGLLLGLLLVALDSVTVANALPAMIGELQGLSLLSWVIVANLLGATVGVPLFGKLSDMYGRRPLLVVAVVFFVAGSLVCGLAQSMETLIVGRAVQGVGGGGITAMAITIVGDMVPPRSRARYQGYLGAEYAVATIVGPFVGGFLTDTLSWRWVFLINLPLGLLALAVVALVLKLPPQRVRRVIDWPGIALLLSGLTCLLLMASWGGQQYPWTSGTVLGLGFAGVVLLAAFVAVERRAPEPIVPLVLFTGGVTRVALVLILLVGVVNFTAVSYLPTFLQIGLGVSATNSGVLLFPLMGGLIVTSIVSGHVISRTGRYRWWPIGGAVGITLGLFLLSRMDADTSPALAAVYMGVVGLGVGCMASLTVIVQNSVPRADLGSATASAGLFRALGGAAGVAVFGAVFTSRLQSSLTEYVPAGALPPGVDIGFLQRSPEALKALPPQVQEGIAKTYAHAITTTFFVAVAIGLACLVAAFLLRETPITDPADPTDTTDPSEDHPEKKETVE